MADPHQMVSGSRPLSLSLSLSCLKLQLHMQTDLPKRLLASGVTSAIFSNFNLFGGSEEQSPCSCGCNVKSSFSPRENQ